MSMKIFRTKPAAALVLWVGMGVALPAFAQTVAPANELQLLDLATGCAIRMVAPPWLSQPALGRVQYFNEASSCVNGYYDGQVSYGFSGIGQSANVAPQDIHFWRYGYAVNGRLTGLYLNAYLVELRIIQDGRLVARFSQGESAYQVQAVLDAIDQAAKSVPLTQFNPDYAKGLARIWDKNSKTFLSSFAKGQSDDFKTTGRGARGG